MSTNEKLERALLDLLDTFGYWFWPGVGGVEKKWQCKECGGAGASAAVVEHCPNCTISAAEKVLQECEDQRKPEVTE